MIYLLAVGMGILVGCWIERNSFRRIHEGEGPWGLQVSISSLLIAVVILLLFGTRVHLMVAYFYGGIAGIFGMYIYLKSKAK